MVKEYINVGKVLTAHGIKGQLKTEVLSDNPLRFLKGQSLFVQKLGRELKITGSQNHNGVLLLSLEGITDRNAAEALAGSLLQADKASVPPLPEGEYYYFQIEGMEVFDAESNELIGTVSEVLEYSANDIFVIKREGKKDLLLPALKSVVQKLDIPAKQMKVIIPDGLED